jgi:hypothetical protein
MAARVHKLEAFLAFWKLKLGVGIGSGSSVKLIFGSVNQLCWLSQ